MLGQKVVTLSWKMLKDKSSGYAPTFKGFEYFFILLASFKT